MKEKSKKPFYKKWWFFAIIAFVILGIIFSPSEDERKQAEKEKVQQEEKKQAEKKNEKTEKSAENVDKTEAFTKDQEDELLVAYDTIIEESEGFITKIESEDNYNIINVFMSDDFKTLGKEQKQELVDALGNKIENNTRSRLFGTGIKDFKFVYFKDSKGEFLADTNHFDRKWEVK